MHQTRPRASRAGRSGRSNEYKLPSTSRTLESLGPFRYLTKKKPKATKWAPIDLSDPDTASEAGDAAMEPNSLEVESIASSPISELVYTEPGNQTTAITSSNYLTQVIFPSNPLDISSIAFYEEYLEPHSGIDSGYTPTKSQEPNVGNRYLCTEFDIDTTPTQTRFESTALNFYNDTVPQHPQHSRVLSLSTDVVPADAAPKPSQGLFYTLASTPFRKLDYGLEYTESSGISDTQSVKDRLESAMSQLKEAMGTKKAPTTSEDAFDSFEWDPDLPSGSSPDKSPEPVPIKPQPVAYTTVGSLVDPSVVHQFTAPNRIQREGANRRSLMSILQGRQYDLSFYQPRGQPLPLQMSNSMHYAQQLAQSPVHAGNTPPPDSTPSSRSTLSNQPTLTEQEKEVLVKHLRPESLQQLQKPQGRNTSYPAIPSVSSDSTVDTSRHAFSVSQLLEEDARVGSNATQGPVQGLEKMQTLQRLAKFDNPMQKLARSRLSEFSVARSQGSGKTIINQAGLTAHETNGCNQKGEFGTGGNGEMKHNFQFPSAGFVSPLNKQANPFLGSATAGTSLSMTFPSRRPSGYPEPLTAGPPGQRQYTSSFGISNESQQSVRPGEYGMPSQHLYEDESLNRPFYENDVPPAAVVGQKEAVGYNSGLATTKIVNTIPLSAGRSWFPNGFPTDMIGFYDYKPMSEENLTKMGLDPLGTLTAEEETAKRAKELEDFFYYGQRRYASMTADNHIEEHEEHQRAEKSRYGPIGPPKKKAPAVEVKKWTEEDTNSMTIPQAAAPLLDAAFGTLLSYAYKSSGTRSDLSRFTKSPDWQLDLKDGGARSLFGEDWGAPPKRFGRDPRRQSTI